MVTLLKQCIRGRRGGERKEEKVRGGDRKAGEGREGKGRGECLSPSVAVEMVQLLKGLRLFQTISSQFPTS